MGKAASIAEGGENGQNQKGLMTFDWKYRKAKKRNDRIKTVLESMNARFLQSAVKIGRSYLFTGTGKMHRKD